MWASRGCPEYGRAVGLVGKTLCPGWDARFLRLDLRAALFGWKSPLSGGLFWARKRALWEGGLVRAASTTAAVACKASSRSGTRPRLRTSGFALGNPLVARVWPFVPELPPLPLIRTMRGALQGALTKRQQAGLLARRP